jgi:hypothetical protein
MDSEHDKLFCMEAAHDRLPWGPAIVCRESLKEASRCMIQVAFYVELDEPLCTCPVLDTLECSVT